MTDKEKEAARKLKEKLSKSAKGVETEEEKADREKVAAEAKRTGKLRDTEEGREQLEQELYAKEAKRQKAEDTADVGLRDITGKNREAKEEMRKQANRPEVKAANAVRDLGKTGVKELLKIAGVDDDRAGKITEGLDHVLTKGNLDHEGVNAAKDVALEKGRDFAKDLFNKGVANRKKLFENDKKEDSQPVVGSREMPAEVNVNIRNADANVPPNVPAIAAAAAAGEVAQSNIPPNVPPAVVPGNPSSTSSPANLGGSGMPKRARSDSGSDDETLHVVHSMPRRGEYHMEGGSMHMHAQNRVYGGGIGNWSLPSLKDPSVAKYFSDIGNQVKRTVNPNLAELTDKLVDTFGYTGYDAKTAKFLKEHGSEEVTTLTVRRAPVGSMLHTALNAISMGTWSKSRHEFGYDKLYHLGLIINRRYITQRLSRVTVTLKDADSPGSEFMEVDLKNNVNELFTIKSMLQKTERSVGANVFFKYDSFKNNCQNFVLNILVANGLNNQALQQFILQPVDELLKAQPEYMQTVTNTLTNLGQITGAGKPPGLYANIHAKQERIRNGSGETMRKPGSEGAPTAEAFKESAKTAMHGSGQGFSRAPAPETAEEKEHRENIAGAVETARVLYDHLVDTMMDAIDQYPDFEDRIDQVRHRANREFNKLVTKEHNLLMRRYNDLHVTRPFPSADDEGNMTIAAADCTDALGALLEEVNELKREAANIPSSTDRKLPAIEPHYAAGAGKPKGSK